MGLFPEVQIFQNGEPLALAQIFPTGTLLRSHDQHSTKFYGSIVVRAIAIKIAMQFIIPLPLDRDVL